MLRINEFGAAAVSALVASFALATIASGAATPGAFPFHDCVGPVGTPSSFTATKENLPESAAHGASAGISYKLTEGSGVFVVQEFGESPIAPGIPENNLSVTCQVDLPSGSFTFTGFLVPRGA